MSYKLVDCDHPFKKILHGKKWVGRVVKCTDGRYLARINNARGPATEVYGTTAIEAFEEAVAQQFGFNNAGELHNHNANVRTQNRSKRQRTRALAWRFQHGNLQEKINVVDELLGIKK